MKSEQAKARRGTLGVVIRPGLERAITLAVEVISWAHRNGYDVAIDPTSVPLVQERVPGIPITTVSAAELGNLCDPVVVLGGDGSLIGIAHFLSKRWSVMIGVNFGHLGFLTEIAPDELMQVLDDYLANKVLIGERRMVRAKVIRGTQVVFEGQAVNEAAVLKSAKDRLLDMRLSVDQEEVLTLRADGLLVATTTGSTAYSLAAGGSIVHPNVPALLITPIMPHLLAIRPLVLPLDSEIEVDILPYDGEVMLSLDGQLHVPLQVGDTIAVTRSEVSVRFVRSPSKNYYEILRQKLSWGSSGVVRC